MERPKPNKLKITGLKQKVLYLQVPITYLNQFNTTLFLNIYYTTYQLHIILTHAGVDNKASPNNGVLCRTQGMMDL